MLLFVLVCLGFGAAPPTPPSFPLQFSINFTSVSGFCYLFVVSDSNIQTVFELGQVGNGTLFYNFVQSPTPSNPSWQVVHNDLCPTGNVNASCRYVFLDDGAKQQFWVVTNNFCCLAVDTGPVIPGIQHFLFFSFDNYFPNRCSEKLAVLGDL